MEAADFEFHNTEYKPGKSVGNLPREIMKKIDTRDTNVKDYIDILSNFTYILSIFLDSNVAIRRLKIFKNVFKKFYRFSVGDESFMQWVKFLELLHVGNNLEGVVKEILHQYILDKFFQVTLKYRNDVLCPKFEENVDDDISPLDTIEEQTIRYVADYILYSIRNSLQNKRSSNGIPILNILPCWGSKSSSDFEPSSFLDYTKEWIEKVNRGSLVVINDDLYIFVRHLEIETRKILNLNFIILYSGKNIKLKVSGKLSENNLIWCY